MKIKLLAFFLITCLLLCSGFALASSTKEYWDQYYSDLGYYVFYIEPDGPRYMSDDPNFVDGLVDASGDYSMYLIGLDGGEIISGGATKEYWDRYYSDLGYYIFYIEPDGPRYMSDDPNFIDGLLDASSDYSMYLIGLDGGEIISGGSTIVNSAVETAILSAKVKEYWDRYYSDLGYYVFYIEPDGPRYMSDDPDFVVGLVDASGDYSMYLIGLDGGEIISGGDLGHTAK